LSGALIVAVFGAVLFGEINNTDPWAAFRIMFGCASLGLFIGFGFFLLMPEKPLRTSAALVEHE
jgi:hypothetical protein